MLQRLDEGGSSETAYLLEITQMFLSSMVSQLMVTGYDRQAEAAALNCLQQEPGSGLLTAYLGGSHLPTTSFSVFPSWGFI